MQLRRWARRRHPNKNATWVANRYWSEVPGRKWVFAARHEGRITEELAKHVKTQIKRHVKTKGTASPFDGNLLYWAQRLREHPLTRGEEAKLLRRQQGRCTHCGVMFRPEDLRESDHCIPRERGGSNTLANKQVLHRHCHDEKTARDAVMGSNDKVPVVEEPGKVKVLRPVLKTSPSREGVA
jgi:RNA-directed DNA polymerase